MSTQRIYQLLISFAIITAIASASDRSRIMASILSVIPLSMTLGLWFIYSGANGYSLADAVVFPAVLEGLGITPIEAMACGTPAVVTSASSGPEEVGDAGVIVPPCDSEALALGIRRLLEDGNLRRDLGQRGREHVLQHFSCQRMADPSVRTYERYLQTGSGEVR